MRQWGGFREQTQDWEKMNLVESQRDGRQRKEENWERERKGRPHGNRTEGWKGRIKGTPSRGMDRHRRKRRPE